MSIVKFAALGLGAALIAGAAHASILSNGDFETPAGLYGLPPGWNGSTALNGGPFNAPNLFVASGADYVPCCGVTGAPANLANHFATFGAGDTTHVGGNLVQSFGTSVGQAYLLSFSQATFGAAGTQTLRLRIRDLSNSTLTLLQDFTVATNNDLDNAFTFHAIAFTATGALSQIRLENISPVTANIDAAVDNFAIIPRGGDAIPEGGLPEPATWAMMLLGFGGAGAALRRRGVAPIGGI